MGRKATLTLSARRDKRREDFGLIERALEPAAAGFVERLAPSKGCKLLDVGCGAGKCSIAAAHAGADVTGVDPREPFLSRARAWAKNEHLLIRFRRVERTRLPFSDGAFQVTLSFLWPSFSPDPAGLVAEMRRVTRPGGTIALATWLPGGIVEDMLRTAYRYSGDDGLHGELEGFAEPGWVSALGADVQTAEREALLSFPLGPTRVARCYVYHHPVVERAALSLTPEQRQALEADLAEQWHKAGGSKPGRVAVRERYREYVIAR